MAVVVSLSTFSHGDTLGRHTVRLEDEPWALPRGVSRSRLRDDSARRLRPTGLRRCLPNHVAGTYPPVEETSTFCPK
jgi:hypothetical protein